MNRVGEYRIGVAVTDDELRQVLELQASNLRDGLSESERLSQGFVTLRHDLPLLREMNSPWAHVIATWVEGAGGRGEVVGYALVMPPGFRARLPLLEPMFDRVERLSWRGRSLRDWRWYVMGQVCVARAHRGQGLVERMYAEHRARMSHDFDLVITEIDRANPRSIRAHKKSGFETIHEYRAADGRDWVIVAMELGSAM